MRSKRTRIIAGKRGEAVGRKGLVGVFRDRSAAEGVRNAQRIGGERAAGRRNARSGAVAGAGRDAADWADRNSRLGRTAPEKAGDLGLVVLALPTPLAGRRL